MEDDLVALRTRAAEGDDGCRALSLCSDEPRRQCPLRKQAHGVGASLSLREAQSLFCRRRQLARKQRFWKEPAKHRVIHLFQWNSAVVPCVTQERTVRTSNRVHFYNVKPVQEGSS